MNIQLLIKNEREKILENVICDIRDENGEKLSKLKDEPLYDTIVNEKGEIVLCDKNGKELDKNGLNKEGVDCRVKLCLIEDVEFENIYPELEKNKTDKTKIFYKSSGINNFDNEKEYYSTENLKEYNLKEPEEIITYQNRPSRANIQPEENVVMFAKMKDTNKNNKFLKPKSKNQQEREKRKKINLLYSF